MGAWNANTLTSMKDDFQKATRPAPDDDVATYFQLKKLKRWLGARNPQGDDESGGPVSYGDGHSGWNR